MECKGKAEQKAESVEKGINRNIVECKAMQDIMMDALLNVLIETSWNVK